MTKDEGGKWKNHRGKEKKRWAVTTRGNRKEEEV